MSVSECNHNNFTKKDHEFEERRGVSERRRKGSVVDVVLMCEIEGKIKVT